MSISQHQFTPQQLQMQMKEKHDRIVDCEHQITESERNLKLQRGVLLDNVEVGESYHE
jgi:hypothetical protein